MFEYCDSNTWYVAELSGSLKNTLVFPPLNHVDVATLCWPGLDLHKLCSDWQLMIFGRIAYLIIVVIKLTTFHLLLFYKRNTKRIPVFGYCDPNVWDVALFPKAKNAPLTGLCFFMLFSSLATSRVFGSQYPITGIHLVLLKSQFFHFIMWNRANIDSIPRVLSTHRDNSASCEQTLTVLRSGITRHQRPLLFHSTAQD